MNTMRIVLLSLFVLTLFLIGMFVLRNMTDRDGSASNSTVVQQKEATEQRPDTAEVTGHENVNKNRSDTVTEQQFNTSRKVSRSESISLPLSGSAPTEDVTHSIPIEEIRRGCFSQDCIPSVDDPDFMSAGEADEQLPDDTIGIGLNYKDETRFYPFNMLVTREIVNDAVAGDPLLVTYCPLCGTGIVFERQVQGTVYEFGVSGMLWQSNLLMYNRAENIDDRSLWSQVLGEAVVGPHTGTKLEIVPSNIVSYTDWRDANPETVVLNTGRIGDPYGGDYYGVARNFNPDFDESSSPIDPSAYVHGVGIDGTFKAYPDSELPTGTTRDTVAGTQLTIERTEIGEIEITDNDGEVVPIISGFWFSWIAAHPETELWMSD